MIDLAIVVEGPTEERFVQRVLAPALWVRGITAWPVLPGEGEHRRGGARPWGAIRRDVLKLLLHRTDRSCAILFDYYALPSGWPGRADAASGLIDERGTCVENAVHADIVALLGSSFPGARFIPHIQLHEYEARLFSDCGVLAGVLGIDAAPLHKIVQECGSPERIDDGLQTAPSKRLDALCRTGVHRGYRKTTDGVIAAERITLEKMRAECPHFARWLARIEGIGAEPNRAGTGT